MKSKEPKQAKEKNNSEAKPRKSAEKAKRILVEAVSAPEVTVPVHAADGPMQHINDGAGLDCDQAMLMADGDPPEDLVRMRAYELFLQRGGEHGRHMEDWLAAERELKMKHRAT